MEKLTSMTFFNRVSFEFVKIVKSVKLFRFSVFVKFLESVMFKLFGLFGCSVVGLGLTAGQVQGALEHGL